MNSERIPKDINANCFFNTCEDKATHAIQYDQEHGTFFCKRHYEQAREMMHLPMVFEMKEEEVTGYPCMHEDCSEKALTTIECEDGFATFACEKHLKGGGR